MYNYKVCRVNMLHKFFIIVIDYSFLSKKVAVHFPKRLPYIFQKGCRTFSKKVAVHFPKRVPYIFQKGCRAFSKKVAMHFPKRLPYIFQKGCRTFSKKVAVHFPPQSSPSIACLFTQLRCFEK